MTHRVRCKTVHAVGIRDVKVQQTVLQSGPFVALFNFLKFFNNEDTTITECGIKVTSGPDVSFFHSLLAYNTPKGYILSYRYSRV